MALETAVGPIAVAENLLGETIANATQFLTFTGEATVNDAKNHIYYGALPKPASGAEGYTKAERIAYRPFVIVWASDVLPLSFVRRASGNHYHFSGTVFAMFERDTPSGETQSEAERSWHNVLGKLLKQTTESDPFDGILDQADTADRLTINQGQVLDMESGTAEEIPTLGEYQVAVCQFEWGIS